MLNSVIVPLGVISPIAGVVPSSANQRFPSDPTVSDSGSLPAFSPVLNSVIVPLGVISPIAGVLPLSRNHRSPFGPDTIEVGKLPAFSPELNSVMPPPAAAAGTPAHSAKLAASAAPYADILAAGLIDLPAPSLAPRRTAVRRAVGAARRACGPGQSYQESGAASAG